MGVTIDHAHFIAVWFEALLYGIYLCLFLGCFYVLYSRPVNGKRPTVMLSALAVMFILNTGHVAGTLRNVEDAFFRQPAGTAAQFLSDRSQALNLLNKSLYAAVLIIGDGLLIYRCWVIWQKNWWIILPPVVLLLATTATGLSLVYFYSKLKPGQSIFSGQVAALTPITLVLSLCSNVTTTGLIALRIRLVSKAVQGDMTSKAQAALKMYQYSLAVIVESGAIYPIFLIVSCADYLSGSNVQAVFTGSMCQIIGIVPTLAVLQVRLGLSRYDAAFADKDSDAPATSQGNNATIQSPPRQKVTRASIIPKNANRRTLSSGSTAYTIAGDEKAGLEDLEAASGDSLPELAPVGPSKPAMDNMVLTRPMSIHFQRTVVRQSD